MKFYELPANLAFPQRKQIGYPCILQPPEATAPQKTSCFSDLAARCRPVLLTLPTQSVFGVATWRLSGYTLRD